MQSAMLMKKATQESLPAACARTALRIWRISNDTMQTHKALNPALQDIMETLGDNTVRRSAKARVDSVVSESMPSQTLMMRVKIQAI